LKLHYVDWGNPGAEPLLMIHGGRDHCRNWDWVAQRMRDRYHVMALDLRGHGDSAWAIGGAYSHLDHIQDIAQLVNQKVTGPVTVMAHSMGAMVSLSYAGIFPETLKAVIAIEGIPPAPMIEGFRGQPVEERLQRWVEMKRELSRRTPRRYATIEDAVLRMQSENKHLNEEQARHLSIHGAYQNEDGTYSWKFDPYVRFGGGPGGLTAEEQHRLWSRVTCPLLLVSGADSFFPNPAAGGKLAHLKTARLATIPDSGHWVHHDQLDRFMAETWAFLGN
jgi:pimeloyl-ACP methyl ester carboxylesterase